jgi:uncharacterized protein
MVARLRGFGTGSLGFAAQPLYGAYNPERSVSVMRSQHHMGLAVSLLLAAFAAPAALAQSFDCTKARSPTERAICSDPSLGALDRAVADAFGQAMSRPQADGAALRAGQFGWLRQRDAGCKVPAPRLTACLKSALTERLAVLASPVVASPSAPSAPGAAIAEAPPALPPAIPSKANPRVAEAALDRDSLPASAAGDTLLHVRVAGRFSITARSASGTALQLVDMMAGPGDPMGDPGVRDGRIDVLLDVGTYKLRTLPAPGAAGDVQIAVVPFHDAAPPAAIPPPGDLLSAPLADGQQRAFWLAVGPDGMVRIDAIGRALADLRLWSDGTALAPLEPEARPVEPVRGHPMSGLRLAGKVEPGTYLVVAYAGPPAVWADGDTGMPFHLRAGLSPRLQEGVVAGVIGAGGSEVFAAPPRAGLFRLSLPDPAPAVLAVDDAEAAIAANSREPRAMLRTQPNRGVVTVTGITGQAFRLLAQETSSVTTIAQPGPWWISAAAAGAGGDEAPPTALLIQRGPGGVARVLASTAPLIRDGVPWRTQFNVRGSTTLLLQNGGSGELSVRSASQGIGVMQWEPRSTPLPGGFVQYSMEPPAGKEGIADLLFGLGTPTGLPPPATARWPADPVIPFGRQVITAPQRLELAINRAPGLQAGLLARPLPVVLAEGPLAVAQMPGVTLEIPVRITPGGSLVVSDAATGSIEVWFNPAADGTGIVALPAPQQPRTVVLAWRRAVTARPAIPAPSADRGGLAFGADGPRFLDLRNGEQRSFDLTIPEGGLYRVETTGRLHTTATIGTAFIPELDTAEANGIGENALLQRWLRAGRYRVRVGATGSAGHLGVMTSRAPMREGVDLRPGGSVRASLLAGSGLATPLVITEAGRYRIELLGQGRTFNARLDDAEGWPLTVPGPMTTLERDFTPGNYRLLVSPEAVDVRVVARLSRIVPPAEIVGHGPHPLIDRATAHAVWREPSGRDDVRTPDVWSFTLAGAADTTLTLADGMVADLLREGADKPVLRLLGPRPWTGRLEPGRYRLEASSLGRNDRLDYTLRLVVKELQPGVPRRVDATSRTPFTLAQPAVVSLTTFGPAPLKAVLRDGAGAEIGRYGDRGDDWNIAISRLLSAGAYSLDVSPATPPGLSDTPAPAGPPSARTTSDDNDGEDDDKPDVDPGEPRAQSSPRRAERDTVEQAETSDMPRIELALALPPQHEPVAAPGGVADLAGGGVHRLSLAQPSAGRLVLATAQSSAAVVLAIERQNADGWRVVALDQGTAPMVAVPSDEDQAEWRVSVWPVDGGTAPIRASVAAVDVPAQPSGVVIPRSLEAATAVAITRIGLDAPALVRLTGATLAGGWPGHALEAPDGVLVSPQSTTLWLVGRTVQPVTASAVDIVAGQTIAVPVPAGGMARLASTRSPAGTLRAWRAESGVGQPGIDAGQGMGVAPGSALAVGTAPPRVWNAGGTDGLRPRVTPLDFMLLPAQRLDGPLATMLPPGSALVLSLPAGARRTDLALAPGVAAVAGEGDRALTVWAGDAAEARSLPGDWTRLVLLNLGTTAAPASVSWGPASTERLAPGAVLKRYFGAAGAFTLPVDAPAGARLRTAGDVQATFVGTGARQPVMRGRDLVLPGLGQLTIAHGPGPLAVWLDMPGTSAWPAVEVVAQAMPAQLTLAGPAMALSLAADTPKLLHARTTAPVILTLGRGTPELFPAGAVLDRYVAGNTVLRVDSAHEGPLSGTLELAADPVTPIGDGLGEAVALAPGHSAVFAFRVPRATAVGVGVRAEPDTARVRLLASDGAVLGEGSAMLRRLDAGRYLIDVSLPPDAAPTLVRPAVVGIRPRTAGPPPEIAAAYLGLVGLAPKGATP